MDWNGKRAVRILCRSKVTPFAGVWIEIVLWTLLRSVLWVTPFAGVWIEMASVILSINGCNCHSLCGSVDWNIQLLTWNTDTFCHSLCGSVDWNEAYINEVVKTFVTPFAGVWIEIPSIYLSYNLRYRHSLCGSVDWNPTLVTKAINVSESLPLRECGLKYPRVCLRIPGFGHSLCGSVDWNHKLVY